MMDKEKMEKMDKTAGEHMLSFALKSGTDLKAHLGHKIEVKGTTDKSMAEMKPMVLTVTSVKMISATCPQ